MSLAYFPLYSERYEADTAHLSILEDGAYNRLLRLCWRSPECKLPNDLPWIFRQMRAHSEGDKAAVVAVLTEFFTKGRGKIWSKKLLEVHMQVSVAHQGKSEAGKKGAAAKALKSNKAMPSTATAQLEHSLSNQNQNQNQNQTEEEEGGGGSASATKTAISESQNPTFREQILTAAKADPVSGLTGPNGKRIGTQADMAEAAKWLLDLGLTESECIAEIVAVVAAKRDGPPTNFRYFSPAMARLSAAKNAPPLQPDTTTQPKGPRQNERAAFDRAINALADGLDAGTVHIDNSASDPWAAVARINAAKG